MNFRVSKHTIVLHHKNKLGRIWHCVNAHSLTFRSRSFPCMEHTVYRIHTAQHETNFEGNKCWAKTQTTAEVLNKEKEISLLQKRPSQQKKGRERKFPEPETNHRRSPEIKLTPRLCCPARSPSPKFPHLFVLARFGHLSFEMHRACRLVADTGIHFYGYVCQFAGCKAQFVKELQEF